MRVSKYAGIAFIGESGINDGGSKDGGVGGTKNPGAGSVFVNVIGEGKVCGFLEKTFGEEVMVDVKGESGGVRGVVPFVPFCWGVWLFFFGER